MERTNQSENTCLILRIVDHSGKEQTVECDSVRLYAKDGKDDKNGGFIGIHRGHSRAIIALGNQSVLAFLDGQTVYDEKIPGGIASVNQNEITVFLD